MGDKWVKNNDTVAHTWVGVLIQPAATYLMEESEQSKFASDSQFITDLTNDIAQVGRDQTTMIADVNKAINFLKDFPQLVDDQGNPVQAPYSFAYPGSTQFNGQGVKATITAGTTADLDFVMAQINKFNGLQYILKNQAEDDTLKLQLIDIDNVLGYGANYVVYTFAENWNVSTDKEDQGVHILPYAACIPSGLYLRVKYTSTGGTNVKLKVNYFLHKEIGT